MKNKKGFTLIELLAVFIIMFMILGIAIYSFTRVRKAKEEEAWTTVKSEVESAAIEYFNANAWTQEKLSDCPINSTQPCDTAYITVGKLVNEDYLSPVTNPTTGNLVDSCTKVNVTKNGKNFRAQYVDEIAPTVSGSCDNNNVLSIVAAGGTDLEYKYGANGSLLSSKPDWFNSSHSDPYILIRKAESSGIAIQSITDPEGVSHEGPTFQYNITKEGCFNSLVFIAKNKAGYESSITVDYCYDKTAPTLSSFNAEGKDFTGSKKTNIELSVEDKGGSGIKSVKVLGTEKFNGGENISSWTLSPFEHTFTTNYNKDKNEEESIPIKLEDSAGNTSNPNQKYNLYKLCSQTEVRKTGDWGECQCVNNAGTQSRTVTMQSYDVNTNDKCGNVTIGTETQSCILSGCGEAPLVNVRIYRRKSDGSNGKQFWNKDYKVSGTAGYDRWWVNDNSRDDYHAPYGFNIEFTPKDANLTSAVMYYNKTGLTKAAADNTNYRSTSGATYKGMTNFSGNSLKINGTGSTYLSGEGSRKAYLVFTANGKTTSVEITLNMDRTKPNISNYSVVSSNSNYNTQKAKVSIGVSDAVSGIRTVKTNLKNQSDVNSWTINYNTSWTASYTSTIATSYNGKTVTPTISVKDGAGNSNSLNTYDYRVYKDLNCKVVKSTKGCKSSANNAITGQLKVICSKPVKKIKVVYKYATTGCGCKESDTTYSGNSSLTKHGTYINNEPTSGKNAAVFNFRGCCATYKLSYANFTITDYLGYTTTKSVSNWSTGANGSSSGSCNPDRGMATISY